MSVDFNNIPFVQAKYVKRVDGSRPRRKLVMHSMEAPEKGTTAEGTANYFKNPPRPGSAHYCVDNNSIVQCVQTRDIAYGAAGANNDGIHIELAGYARQTRAQWLDEYSTAMLKLAAQLCAVILVPKFHIPVVQLTVAQLKNPLSSGFTTHADVNKAFKEGDHWDPGPGFPMDIFLGYVKSFG